MVPILKLHGPLWEALRLKLSKYLPSQGTLKATVWAGRHPCQGHATLQDYALGALVRVQQWQMGVCWLVPPDTNSKGKLQSPSEP